jgi:hypothetical protein
VIVLAKYCRRGYVTCIQDPKKLQKGRKGDKEGERVAKGVLVVDPLDYLLAVNQSIIGLQYRRLDCLVKIIFYLLLALSMGS